MARANLYSGIGLASLLTDRDILPHILRHLDNKKERCVVRQLSSDVRATFDAQAESLRLQSTGIQAVAEQELTIRGILARGCRPDRVDLLVAATEQAAKQRTGIRLLRPFADASRNSPLPTKWLSADTSLLAAETAPHAVAKAFPELKTLSLWDDGAFNESFAAALQLLLGTAGGSGSPQQPLLPNLTDLRMVMPNLREKDLPDLPPAVAAGLRGATQLRRLELSFNLPAAAAERASIEDLAGLVGLESVRIGSVGTPLIGPLAQPLTALTSLAFRCPESLSADVLAGLPAGLVRLAAHEARLDVSGLSRLSSLTQLSCAALVAPPGPVAPLVPVAAPRSWALPPRLASCTLFGQRPEQLPRFRPHAALRWNVVLTLKAGQHLSPESALLPEAEAALCGAASILADSMARGSTVKVETQPAPGQMGDVWPVGGEAEVGPGRRNHRTWLEALGQTRMSRLLFKGFALSHQDLETVSCMRSVETLQISWLCSYPSSALPLLARLPALVDISLDVNDWILGSKMEGPMRIPPHASGALLALCNDGRWPGKALTVNLNHSAHITAAVKSALDDFVAELKKELRLLGVNEEVLRLVPYSA